MIVEQDISKVRIGMYVLKNTLPKVTFHLIKAHWLESQGIIDGLKRKGLEKVLIDTSKIRVLSITNESSQTSPKRNPLRQKKTEPSQLFQREVMQANRVFDRSKEIQRRLFHDVRKSIIPASSLNKPQKRTDDEFEVMKSRVQHSIDAIERTPNSSS